jgi:hypothetical protein
MQELPQGFPLEQTLQKKSIFVPFSRLPVSSISVVNALASTAQPALQTVLLLLGTHTSPHALP